MKYGLKYNISQLFNSAENSYLERTSRPVYAIVFLLPFIVFYELGTILINTDVLNQTQVRVVAFVWLQNFLEYLGFTSKFAWMAPPLVVVVILIALQLMSRKRWSVVLADVWPMAIECVLLAVPLIVLSLVLSSAPERSADSNRLNNTSTISRLAPAGQNCNSSFNKKIRIENSGPAPSCSAITTAAENKAQDSLSNKSGDRMIKHSLLANVVTGIGAGIYEELIFRLVLICVLMIVFQDILGFSHTNSIVLSVLVSAALFSAHHHMDLLSGQVNHKDMFTWTEFGFRTIAGVYFAILFAVRGFGITAGAHAFYDIIATVINAVFFQQ